MGSHAVCVCVCMSLNIWARLYETWCAYHGNWAHLNGALPSACVSPNVPLLPFLCNVTAAINRHGRIQELLDASFSILSVFYQRRTDDLFFLQLLVVLSQFCFLLRKWEHGGISELTSSHFNCTSPQSKCLNLSRTTSIKHSAIISQNRSRKTFLGIPHYNLPCLQLENYGLMILLYIRSMWTWCVFQCFMIRLYMFKTVYVEHQLTAGSSQLYVRNYNNFTTLSSLNHLNITFCFHVISMFLGL